MKQQYNVYLRQTVEDCTNNPSMAIRYEDFVGRTWAVSAAQAANNVRFRNGDKRNKVFTGWGTAQYHAILATEDKDELHKKYIKWAETH